MLSKEKGQETEFFKLCILGTYDQGGRDKPLFHVSLDLAWENTQGLSEFTQLLPKCLPAYFMLFLKKQVKETPGLSKAYMETSQTSGIQNGLMTFSSVIWATLTFRNFVQVLLVVNLRSLRDSKYNLKNLSFALYYHPQNNLSWLRMMLWRLFHLIEQRDLNLLSVEYIFIPPPYK